MLWISQPHGRPPTFSFARSAPVNTATTPGDAFAAAVSMRVIRACACGERTNTANVCCGSTTSSVYWPAPVRNR